MNDHEHHYWGWTHRDKMDTNSHLWKDDPDLRQGCVVLDGKLWGIRRCDEKHYQLCEGH